MSLFKDEKSSAALYVLMDELLQCGPFDGGCIAFAKALQRHFGCGSVAVLTGRWRHQEAQGSSVIAQHAFVYLTQQEHASLGSGGSSLGAGSKAQLEVGAVLDASSKGFWVDASGCKDLKQGVEDFNAQECFGKLTDLGVRCYLQGDLSDCEQNDVLVQRLVDFLQQQDLKMMTLPQLPSGKKFSR